MPRYRSTYTIERPKPILPAGFFECRAAFRAADFDLFCESTIRFVARAGAETFGPWRSIAEARDWLAGRPAQSQGRRPGRAR